ncbi:MAG: MBOAT family protein [Clostridia bacterium]|nr:MBOAT family protein [Clostridia bacterium]
MAFASGYFPLFFAVLLLLYYLLPRRLQKVILLFGSLFFYLFSGWQNLVLILCMSLVAYVGGRSIDRKAKQIEATLAAESAWDKAKRKEYRRMEKRGLRARMYVSVVLLLLCLAFFKYTPAMSALIGGGQGIELLFPMGLSFFTFQLAGYVIDVFRGSIVCETSYLRFCLFSCYFPQMVQGPISRYGELTKTLFAPVAFDAKGVSGGLFRVLLGYIKKLVIADTAMIVVQTIVSDAQNYRGAGVAVLLLLYSVQIYADFTGGMDIALGCSEMLGIRLQENFDHPFRSTSVKEYWRRWHISMGRWFTDYVFYPLSISGASQKLSRLSRRLLGENVGKRIPVWIATLLTWLLTGIWHGAGWNFALWGILNGVTILISQELTPLYRRLGVKFPRYTASGCHRILSCVRIFLLMGLYRTLDVYRSVPLTMRMWGSLFDPKAWRPAVSVDFWTSLGLGVPQWMLLLLGIIMMYLLGRATRSEMAASAAKWASGSECAIWGATWRQRLCERPIRMAVILAFMLAVVLIFGRYGYGYDASQFIYNQF